MKAKAAILTRLKEPLVVDEVDVPEPAFGQVLVKIRYSGLCGSQLGEIDGAKGPDRFLPHLLGHEGSGVILKAGPGVKTLKEGDHVVLHWRKGAGLESQTPAYQWKGAALNAGWVTTFNELAVVSENRATAIPKDFDLRLASLLGCAVITGMGIVANDAAVKPGESVVVFGAGGVGLNVIQAAALAGAAPIAAIDITDGKLALAKEFGATHVINSRTESAREAVLRAVGAKGANVVIDNTGVGEVIELSYELTHAQGRTILVGVPKNGERVSIDTLPLHFGKILTGSHGGEAEPALDIPHCLRLFAAGKLKLGEMITDTFSLDRINDAVASLRSGKIAGRAVIEISK